MVFKACAVRSAIQNRSAKLSHLFALDSHFPVAKATAQNERAESKFVNDLCSFRNRIVKLFVHGHFKINGIDGVFDVLFDAQRKVCLF